MESGGSDCGEDVVAKAMWAASITLSAKKKAERATRDVLEVTRRELKRKGKVVEERKTEARKRTMQMYFQSSYDTAGGQPLFAMLDGTLLDVFGVEPASGDEYPSDEYERGLIASQTNFVFRDTTCTLGSSSSSGDTIVLIAKSPLITISKDSSELDNLKLVEVTDDSEGSSDNLDFQSSPLKKSGKVQRKSKSSWMKAQRQYNRHRKFQTLWVAKLPWVEGIMAKDGILHMVKCKVCSTLDRKLCFMAPKSDTLWKHDGKRIVKKDLP